MRPDPTPFLRLHVPGKVLLSSLLLAALLSACGRASPDAKPAGAPADAAKEAAPAPAASMTVTTATVRAEEVVRTVPATGSIFPWQEVIVSAEVGGYRVATVLVDVGSRVQKGQPLVQLSEDMLQAELASRQAALRSGRSG